MEFQGLRVPALALIEGIAQLPVVAFADLLLEADWTLLDHLIAVFVLQEAFLAVCREQMGRYHEWEARHGY